MSDGEPTILVIIGKSWGSIDWILPVLHRLRQQGQGRICAYLNRADTDAQSDRYSDLASLLHEAVDETLTADRLVSQLSTSARIRLLIQNCRLQLARPARSWRCVLKLCLQLLLLPLRRTAWAQDIDATLLIPLLCGHLAGRQVRHIVHDLDVMDYRALYAALPSAGIIVFPHGTNWIEDHQYPESKLRRIRETPAHAVWLTGAERDIPFLRKQGVRCRIVVSGHPKYDPQWIATIREASRRARRDGTLTGEKTMLFMTRPMWKLADRRQFHALVRSVFAVAGTHGLRVLVKLHPSQSRRYFARLIPAAMRGRTEWSTTSALSAAARCDFAVALPTSAVMDAVIAGTPVFEFFDYAKDSYMSFVQEGGRSTSIYRQQNVVVPVDTEPQLQAVVQRMTDDPGYLGGVAAAQRQAIDAILPAREGAIDRILALLEPSARGSAAA